jgi:(R,R)-butanediol dehydrogenase / meso-butanediol dehydrogenase / diacetyl reductase
MVRPALARRARGDADSLPPKSNSALSLSRSNGLSFLSSNNAQTFSLSRIVYKDYTGGVKASVVKSKGVLAVEEVPMPHPGAEEVLIKVHYCGICGSDVRLVADGFMPPGMIPGHEFSGTISEIGSGVSGWNLGERVTANPGLNCGKCDCCIRGDWHHCPSFKILGVIGDLQGAFAEYVKVGAGMLHRLPAVVKDEEAACVEPCAVSLRGVRLAEIKAGDAAVVFGAGAIGLFVVQIVRLAGARAVYVIEPNEKRRRAATALGADGVIDPIQANAVGEVLQLTGMGADVAYVCTAAAQALQQAVEAVRPRGIVMEIGGGDTATIMPEIWMWKEVQVRGSYSYLDEFGLALELFRQRKVTVDGLISEIVPLEKIPQAFESLASPNSEIKILVRPAY